MSVLSQQLHKIKNTQRALKVGPQQQQPTLIFDSHTATTTSPDLVYTLAIIAYSKLLTAQPSLRVEGEVVMGEAQREINRNTLNKEENRQLSEKLIKFLLKLSPFFQGTDCQKVLEYLLQNYKINHFEAEPLALLYLQYWNTPAYLKLVANIPPKILAGKLSFLARLQTEPVNLAYIVKHLLYSHYLISTLLLYTLEYIRVEAPQGPADLEIALGEELPQGGVARCDPRRFLLQVFSELLDRQHTSSYKYIIEFCGKAVGLRVQSAETISMVMLLVTRLLIAGSISDELVVSLHLKMVKKLALYSERTVRSFFDFTLIIWQRRAGCLTKEVLNYLEEEERLITYLSSFKCSLWMILVRLLELYLEGQQCGRLITCVGARVKKDEFYQMYSQQFHQRLFELFERTFALEDGGRTQFVSAFLQENYLHEAAEYYQSRQLPSTQFREYLQKLFPKHSCKANNGLLTFNLALILKKTPVVVRGKAKEQKEERVQSQSEEEGRQTESTERYSLLDKLKRAGVEKAGIDFKDSETRAALLKMVNDYYKVGSSKACSLTAKEKTAILQNYPEEYSLKFLEADLKEGSFIQAIKYLTTHGDLEASKVCILALEQSISLLDNVLFRELLRLSLEQVGLALNTQYKSVIHFANSFFKRVVGKYMTEGRENVQLLRVSEALLKVSQALFLREGIKRGKYHRILHNHGKMLGELLMRVKGKRRVTRDCEKEEVAILDHYGRVLAIFKPENLYLLNIAIIETLTRRELDHSQLRHFIQVLVLGSLRQGAVHHYAFAVGIIKTVVFCSQLGTLSIPDAAILPAFSSSIARKVIADFFGLIKDKFKRVITKKLLLYVRALFQDNSIVEHFKAELVELSRENLAELLRIYTELYRILGAIASEEKQIYSFREAIMDKVTNIFPFDLRLALFRPLLPDPHLYKFLGEQLTQHRPERSQFEQLATIVSILPTVVSSEWVQFMGECLKRGFTPDEQHLSAIFERKLPGDLANYAQYVCALAEYAPDSLHPYLAASVEIIESHCADPNDFTLAIISKMISCLGELLAPYLDRLLLVALSIPSEHMGQFIEEATESLVTPTLIRVIRGQAKEAPHLANFSLFFKQSAAKGVGESLSKTLLGLMGRTLGECAEAEESPEALVRLQAEIFLEIALKMNENQLRKSIIELVRWSEAKAETEEGLPFNLRKLAVVHVFALLSHSLQALFTPLFGYLFDSLLKDYENITSSALEARSKARLVEGKRGREEIREFHEELIEQYLRISLHCLCLLFRNDPDHEFLDSFKIEALADPLSELVLLAQHERYEAVVSESVLPCLVGLHSSIPDDYQMKTVNLKTMVLLKNKNSKIHRAVFALAQLLIDDIKDRFLLLVNDLIPFLLESAASRNQPIAASVRRIIAKIEDLSGEEIQNYSK